jgi:Neutral trehalase
MINLFKTTFILAIFSLAAFEVFGQKSTTIEPDKTLPQTSVTFKTSDKKLQNLFDKASEKARWNIAEFGKYKVLVEGAQYKNVWLETQPMGGYMFAKQNLVTALNNISIFIDYQREDGRLPGMLSYKNGEITARYGWFQGYCFPVPAFELYFWLNKDKAYLEKLYKALFMFDEYLWKTRDSDHDGCLETWCIWDTGEDDCSRFGNSPNSWIYDSPPSVEIIQKMTEKEMGTCCSKIISDFKNIPVPIESMDIMSYSYSGRDVLSKISKELNNGEEDFWRKKAEEVRKKIKSYLWDAEKHVCYDRDNNNVVMNILLHNNLRCMYFGSFDQKMADEFIRHHLMNPAEFWTPMPLPSIAANDQMFKNVSGNNWSGQPQGLTFQRSISALENYGHYAELNLIGEKFLKVISDSLKFTQQFDPFTGTINNSKDGYGPSILSSLEFISRKFGIHLSEDRVFWSCIDGPDDYEYEQKWDDKIFRLVTVKDKVVCTISGKEICQFSKGIRVVTDIDGNITGLVGIESHKKDARIDFQGKSFKVEVEPNCVYTFNRKFIVSQKVPFYNPEK